MALPKLAELLPNPPHKGLPTPQKWGQTWEHIEKLDRKSEPPGLPGAILIGGGIGGGILGAAVGVGVGIPMGPPAVAIPIALSIMGAGIGAGMAFGGLIIKTGEIKGKNG